MNKDHFTQLATIGLLLLVGYAIGNFFPLYNSESQAPETKSCSNISLRDAEIAVKEEPGVDDLIKRNGDKVLIQYDHAEEDQMVFQVFEVVQDTNSSHTVTYDWVTVDRCTGDVRSELNEK